MTVYAPEYVEAPPATPLPFGLLAAAVGPLPLAGHAQMGVQYEPESCAVAYTTVGACYDAEDDKTPDDGTDLVVGIPFTAYVLHTCRAPGGEWARAQGDTRRALELAEGRAVEAQVSAAMPLALGAFDATPTPGSAVSMADGIAVLEGYMAANSAGVGVFHAERAVASKLATGGIVKVDGQRLVTKLGTPLAAGAGYSFVGPPTDPQDPDTVVAAGDDEAWLYATGQVVVRRADTIEVTGPILAKTGGAYDNGIMALAERPYVVTWECFTAAVLVSSPFGIPLISGGGA